MGSCKYCGDSINDCSDDFCDDACSIWYAQDYAKKQIQEHLIDAMILEHNEQTEERRK